MKFSVIIPAYNAAKWIEKCLCSIVDAASAYTQSPSHPGSGASIAGDGPSVPGSGVSIACDGLSHPGSNASLACDGTVVEVIVVDDGSTDDTVAVVTEFANGAVPAFAGPCHISVYRRPHAGQGAARNFGLTVATGDYVWFVDADDFIDRNSFLTLEAAISGKVELRSADVVSLGGTAVPGEAESSVPGETESAVLGETESAVGGDSFPSRDGCDVNENDMLWSGDSDIIAVCAADVDENAEKDVAARRRFSWKGLSACSGRQFLASGRKLYVGTPFSIYRRAFLEEHPLRFIEGIYHEDAEFTPRAWFYASRIRFVDEVLYYVRLTSGSTTRGANPKRAFDSISVAQKALSAFRDSLESCPAAVPVVSATFASAAIAAVDSTPLHRVLRGLDDLLASDLNHALKNCYVFDAATNRELNRCVFEGRSYLFPPLRRSSRLKFRIEYIAFRLFPRHTVEVYRLMHIFAMG